MDAMGGIIVRLGGLVELVELVCLVGVVEGRGKSDLCDVFRLTRAVGVFIILLCCFSLSPSMVIRQDAVYTQVRCRINP
jgi:hypothetical protein